MSAGARSCEAAGFGGQRAVATHGPLRMSDCARAIVARCSNVLVSCGGSPARMFTQFAAGARVLGRDPIPPGAGAELDACARPSSWMLARLALVTLPHHAAIDEAVMEAVQVPTLAGYRYLLARLYGFDAPVLANLLVTPGFDLGVLASRPRASDLANDLLGIGITPQEARMLQHRHEVPRFGSVAEALGWLYVSERITLCHPLMRTRLRAERPALLEIAGTYLRRTRRPHVAWAQLGRLLDRTATCELVASEIVEAAQAAFESQRRWFEATARDDS